MISSDIYENVIVMRGFKVLLAETKKLRFLHLVGMRFSLESWNLLGEGIESNKSLYKVAINRCPMKPESVQAIISALGTHANLETIDLSANGIEDECGSLIVSIIK